MTLVRNQTRDMLSGERGKITFGRNENKSRASSSKNYILCTKYWYIGRVRTSRLLLLSL